MVRHPVMIAQPGEEMVSAPGYLDDVSNPPFPIRPMPSHP